MGSEKSFLEIFGYNPNGTSKNKPYLNLEDLDRAIEIVRENDMGIIRLWPFFAEDIRFLSNWRR